ncbi:MAG: hypothetical protein M1817_000746 [Caeruleum heppii]|nr:MAG: hypothetical protein M1817_000746 [Caeruleum heppii]
MRSLSNAFLLSLVLTLSRLGAGTPSQNVSSSPLIARADSDQSSRVGGASSSDLSSESGKLSRAVSLIMYTYPDSVMVNPVRGTPFVFFFAALEFEGTATESRHYVEMSLSGDGPKAAAPYLRVADLGITGDGPPYPAPQYPGANRMVTHLGYTSLSNAELIDPATGKGKLFSAWYRRWYNRPWRPYFANINTFYIKHLLTLLGLPLPVSVEGMFAKLHGYLHLSATQVPTGTASRMVYQTWRYPVSGPKLEPYIATNWYAIRLANPTLMRKGFFELQPLPARMTGAYQLLSSLRSWAEAGRAPANLWLRGADPEYPTTSGALGEKCRSKRGLDRRCVVETRAASKFALGRIGGVKSTIALVAENTVKGLGVAGFVAAPAFIILDFINGNFVGGAFGVVGLALGAAASLALGAGPVGWIVGGVLSVFFAILPMAFHKPKPAAPINNVTQIIQRAMFGDKDHTGNEKCREQGNSNCTAVYGPGVLSVVFEWNNFDSIAYLTQFNEGYAMTIPEMANTFFVMDKDNKGADKIATIDCQNRRGNANAYGSWGAEDKNKCNHPKFSIKREMITLPNIDQTADKVFERIIPKPGGDCSLVDNTGDPVTIASLNMTIIGRPSAIACNITATINVNGTQVAVDEAAIAFEGEDISEEQAILEDERAAREESEGPTTDVDSTAPDPLSSSPFFSPANASTDGQPGHYIAPPPPTPFEQTLNSSNAVCLSGPGGDQCFPNGTYSAQKGNLGFEASTSTGLAMPAGASLSFSVLQDGGPRTPLPPLISRYTTNQTEANPGFASDVKRLGTHLAQQFTALVSTTLEPPAACLFTETNYLGGMACFGPGGGDLPEVARRKARSVKLHGNATVWLYAQSYGDAGGVHVEGSEEDLAAQPYGAEEDFEKKAVAIWVVDSAAAVV